MKIKTYTERVYRSPILLMIIPITITAFTHLWNPIGFPAVYTDEEAYLGRAMYILQGLGPVGYPYSLISHMTGLGDVYVYDHPYFGPVFLAGVFAMIGYPHSLNPSTSSYDNALHSIEMLFMVPRILMGILAIVDTFLIYKIAEFRYNRNVAFVASILFAVMPLGWFLRMVLLDSILIPFLLASILFALYSNRRLGLMSKNGRSKNNKDDKDDKNIALILVSGSFLGLAIFTKVPVFFMIPLVAFLIYQSNTKHKMRTLGLWFIPVILIPSIYPAYAMYIGQLDVWERSVRSEAYSHYQPINPHFLTSLNRDLRIDPVLIVLGIAGLAYAGIKRDLFILLFIVPYLVSLATIAYTVVPFHFSPLLPGFCIASSKLVIDLTNRMTKSAKKISRLLLTFSIISPIVIFGLISTTILIGANVNWVYYRGFAFVTQYLTDHMTNQGNDNNKVTVVGSGWIMNYPWIPEYVFHKHHNYIVICCTDTYKYHDSLKTDKFIFLRLIDHSPSHLLNEPFTFTSSSLPIELLRIYDNPKVLVTFNRNISQYYLSGRYVFGNEGMYVKYPFSGPDLDRFFLTGLAGIEIRSNYRIDA